MDSGFFFSTTRFMAGCSGTPSGVPVPFARSANPLHSAANEAANAIAAKVQAEVFKAVLSGGESWKYQRWMVAFVSDSQLATPAVVVPVPDDAVVMSVPKFIKAITSHDIPTSTETLIHIAQTSMSEVQRRMTGQASLQLAA